MEKHTEFVNAVGILLKTIPKTLIISIIGLLTIMVYWFCSIFLIANHFYLSNSIVIIIAFSFILAVNWYIMNIALASIQVTFFENLSEDESPMSLEALFATGAIVSILYMSLILFMAHCFKFTFVRFLLTAYGYVLLGFIRIGIGYLYANRGRG